MPVSTPKTPTLVIVNVPPVMSAGGVLPAFAVCTSAVIASASSRRDSRPASLMFGTIRPARGRRGDAQVDVLLDHDLAGRRRPGRVDHRVPLDREQHRLGDQQQRRDPHVRATPAGSRSRSSAFIDRVTSTVRNSVTCGAVNADATMFSAVSLRTPLTGIRCSRAPSNDRRRRRRGRRLRADRSTRGLHVVAGDRALRARCRRAGRRSTPRSRASLRTGGLASTPARRRRRRLAAPAPRPPAPAAGAGGRGRRSGRRGRRRRGSGGRRRGAARRPCAAGAWPRRSAGRSRPAPPCGRPAPARRSGRARPRPRPARPRRRPASAGRRRRRRSPARRARCRSR